ncbi:TIM-barrel domain-containing protein [Synoicihabitans lomoniglobus]|uniref:Glycoside hydrolase family 31 protein n=1 Tax=Synoicihabitans lomoniglobus TaxID=2909285 RepID=A0AAE9ZVK6_9BACT|nr:hypothetical protein [Opitutaceae bacterium LMO-M01]WED63640.1 glycoside hydrolase family 31 protein [Opitutaceae bacterium LMO-M01]
MPFPGCFRLFACPRLALTLFTAVSLSVGSLAAAELTVPGGRLEVVDNEVLIHRHGRVIVHLTDVKFDYHSPLAWAVAQTTPDRIEIKLTYPASVDYAHRGPTTPGLDATLTISTHGDGFRLHATPEWADQTTLEFAHTGDHFFGLSSPLQPDNQHSPDLTGSTVRVEVTNHGEDIVENYASAFSSFYMSSAGYGAFFDTFGVGRYQFALNGRNQIHHETGTLDWYVLLGDDGPTIHRAYFDLIGAPKHVPLWALGPIGWRDQNDGGAAEILDDIKRFADLRLPLTGWFVDRPYSDGAHAWSHMNFSAAFAEPEKWIREIREQHGLEFMTWTATAFFGDTPLNRHLPGGFTYADLSDPETVAQFQQKLTDLQHSIGVKGHKMDRADEKFPEWEAWADETVPRGAKRNTYTYLFIKTHDEALRRTWGDDQFTFARAAIHRSQPYLSAIWGGDPRSSWAGLQGNAANAIRASFMGFPVWGTDVGGYIGEGLIDEELYLRWMQFGVMSGLLEIKLDGSGGDGRDRMPWRYDEAFQAEYRDLLELRMDLLPYLYSLANDAAESGTMMQPLAYRHLDDPRTHAIWDQFYLGAGLMVAPMVTPGSVRDVYLPAGRWYRYNFDRGIESSLVGGHAVVTQVERNEIPLFVRANSLLITGNVYAGNARTWDADSPPRLKIHAFPGEVGESTSFTYIDSADGDAAKVIHLEHDETGISLTAPALDAAVSLKIFRRNGVSVTNIPAGEPIHYRIDD